MLRGIHLVKALFVNFNFLNKNLTKVKSSVNKSMPMSMCKSSRNLNDKSQKITNVELWNLRIAAKWLQIEWFDRLIYITSNFYLFLVKSFSKKMEAAVLFKCIFFIFFNNNFEFFLWQKHLISTIFEIVVFSSLFFEKAVLVLLGYT